MTSNYDVISIFVDFLAIIFERAAKSADASIKILLSFLKGAFIVVKMRGQPLPYYLLFRFHRQISNIHYFDWFYPKKVLIWLIKSADVSTLRTPKYFYCYFLLVKISNNYHGTIFRVWGKNCGF